MQKLIPFIYEINKTFYIVKSDSVNITKILNTDFTELFSLTMRNKDILVYGYDYESDLHSTQLLSSRSVYPIVGILQNFSTKGIIINTDKFETQYNNIINQANGDEIVAIIKWDINSDRNHEIVIGARHLFKEIEYINSDMIETLQWDNIYTSPIKIGKHIWKNPIGTILEYVKCDNAIHHLFNQNTLYIEYPSHEYDSSVSLIYRNTIVSIDKAVGKIIDITKDGVTINFSKSFSNKDISHYVYSNASKFSIGVLCYYSECGDGREDIKITLTKFIIRSKII